MAMYRVSPELCITYPSRKSGWAVKRKRNSTSSADKKFFIFNIFDKWLLRDKKQTSC